MSDRFVTFLLVSRWTSAIVALLYHIRFLVVVDYQGVHDRTGLTKAFYFLTGLGHEAFAVFFVVDGILAGLVLRRHRAGPLADGASRGALLRYAASLYRVLLPALALGAACDLAGSRWFDDTGLYTAFPAFSTLTLSYSALLGNALMLQPFVVPTFGSNGMLYLLSWLFWSFVLLALVLRSRVTARALLLAAAVLLLPWQFLVWWAIWLSGVAVVELGTAQVRRPPPALGGILFVAALLLSRFIGADTDLLPQPFGTWLVGAKYLLTGLAFAAIAWALYPERAQATHEGLRDAALGMAGSAAGQAAALAFFGHFPVMMLGTAIGSALLGQPLMQQPTPVAGAMFVVLALLCLGVTALVGRAMVPGVAATVRRRPA
nr:hypothetical protein [uncultured Massilia sp.]